MVPGTSRFGSSRPSPPHQFLKLNGNWTGLIFLSCSLRFLPRHAISCLRRPTAPPPEDCGTEPSAVAGWANPPNRPKQRPRGKPPGLVRSTILVEPSYIPRLDEEDGDDSRYQEADHDRQEVPPGQIDGIDASDGCRRDKAPGDNGAAADPDA